MRDGVELATDVYLPAPASGEGNCPVILERTAYNRQRPLLVRSAQFFAKAGYAVVLQDSRGRYDSDGDFAFFFDGQHEGVDGFDTLAWIEKQDWCNGRVGTTGFSFSGASQQALAVERPPALRTQIIVDSGYNYWRSAGRQNGAFLDAVWAIFALWLAESGREAIADPAARDELQAALADIDDLLPQLPLRPGRSALRRAPSYERWYWGMASHPELDEFWSNPAAALELFVDAFPDIPVLLLTSWYGVHCWATFEKFLAFQERHTSPTHIISGPWPHDEDFGASRSTGEVDFGADCVVAYDDLRLAWFDRWLRDIPGAVNDWPAVNYFLMGGGEGAQTGGRRLHHGGRWYAAAAWPPEATRPLFLYLHANGTLRPEVDQEDWVAEFSFDPLDPVPTVGGTAQTPLEGAFGLYPGPYDQRSRAALPQCRDERPLAERDDVLVFRSELLERPIDVAGGVRIELCVSTSGLDTDFTVKLIDEYPVADGLPSGFALNLCDTIVRLRFRDGGVEPQAVIPGAFYQVVLGPMPIANRFEAGHRIRLDVSSSSFPQFDVNPNTGRLPFENGEHVVAQNAIRQSRDMPSKLVLRVLTRGTAEAVA